jgi:hypothetical protein
MVGEERPDGSKYGADDVIISLSFASEELTPRTRSQSIANECHGHFNFVTPMSTLAETPQRSHEKALERLSHLLARKHGFPFWHSKLS